MNNHDAGGIVFDRANNRLVSTPGPHGQQGNLIMDRRTNVISSVRIPKWVYPGLIDMFDPGNGPMPRLEPIAVEGDILLVRATHRWGRTPPTTGTPIYLVDLANGSVDLLR